MSANGLITNLTQEIRDLSERKSNLQATISRLNSDKTKLELVISKSESTIKSDEEKLAKISSKHANLSEEIAHKEKELDKILEQIKVKSAQSDAVDAQIKMKQNQAKAEIKQYIDSSVKETKEKCAKLLEEAEVSHKALLEEALQLKADASSEAEQTISSATTVAEARKREANEYYDTKIAKADKEYQDILQKASEKHGEKIQSAISELADLNTKLSDTRLAIESANKEQLEAVESLQQLEKLLSEKREELDSLNILILDKDNVLGTHTKTDNKELVATVQNLQSVINELSEAKESLTVKLEEVIEENRLSIETITNQYEEQLEGLRKQLEEGTYAKYDAEKESLKLEYELKIDELNAQIKKLSTQLANYLADTSKDDTILSLETQLAELNEKLAHTNLELEAKSEFEATIQKIKEELLSKEKELQHALQENKSLKINHKDYADTKERFKALNSDYNVAVSNQLSITNRVVELLITVGIQLLATVYTTRFAEGMAVFVGCFIIAISIANLLWVSYRIYDNLKTAKEMKDTMLQ